MNDSASVFSVATNFDDELPARLSGRPVEELYGSCDRVPVGHGRPRATTPPVGWRRLARHVEACRAAGLGFNLLFNALCLGGLEQSRSLERRIRGALRRAAGMGVGAVTVAHPWVLELAAAEGMRARVSVFAGIATLEQARTWAGLGAAVLALDTHVLCRDLPAIERIAGGVEAEVELPVNIGCLLRCPIARVHAARLAHSSRPGCQPWDPCYEWCTAEKERDPVQVVRSDFIRPEDLHRYEEVGVRRFKLVDRSCSTEALLQRVRAWAERRHDGDLLELIGPRGRAPRTRSLPLLSGLWHLGPGRALGLARRAPELMEPRSGRVLDNRRLDGLLLPGGCRATGCDDCGHCAAIARRAVGKRA